MNYELSAMSYHTICPVILPVPAEVADFKPKDRVIFLSRHARKALLISAEKSGVRLDKLDKDENGVPQPFDGTFWSVTHKTRYVAGVAAPTPTGIDVERIRSFSEGLYKKTAGDSEWALADMDKDPVLAFFRFWTAKEAVLKATGIGIRDLLKCQVYEIVDDHHLRIQYDGKDWLIEHFVFDQHIASIVQNRYRIDWALEGR